MLDLFAKLGIERVRAHEYSGNVQISCPYAPQLHERGTDRNPSCSVKIAEGDVSLFRCFACGSSGSLVGMLRRLNEYRGGALDELVKLVVDLEKQDLGAQVEKAIQKYGQLPPPAKQAEWEAWDEKEIADWVGKVPQYALDRGLSLETCREWGLGYDEKEKRLVFPIRRADGKLVGVTGRALREDIEPRYKDYWGFAKERYLYGEHKLDPKMGRLIVVEGPIKLLTLWGWGYRNVIATMMAVPAGGQLRRLRDLGLDVFMAQDGNKAGQLGRAKFREALFGRLRLFDVRVPEGKGPDDIPQEQFEDILDDAQLVLSQ